MRKMENEGFDASQHVCPSAGWMDALLEKGKKWDQRFMELARLVSTWSKDPSTKIGVALVKDRKVVSTGYNGFPAGIADDDRLHDRPVKYTLVVHAEMNALLQAGHDASHSTAYLWGFPGPPCQQCAKHLIQAGVKRVVTRAGEDNPRWAEDFKIARAMLAEAGVTLDTIEMD
jgi:dCMP deaminase